MINPMFLQVTVLTVSGLSLSKIDDIPSFISRKYKQYVIVERCLGSIPIFSFTLLRNRQLCFQNKIYYETRFKHKK